MALKRDEFATMIEAAIEPYFDLTLGARTNQTIRQWTDEAREAIADQVAEDEIAELQERYDAAVDEIEAVQERLEEIVETVILPDPPAPPEPDMEDKEERRRPLIDSDGASSKGRSSSRPTRLTRTATRTLAKTTNDDERRRARWE